MSERIMSEIVKDLLNNYEEEVLLREKKFFIGTIKPIVLKAAPLIKKIYPDITGISMEMGNWYFKGTIRDIPAHELSNALRLKINLLEFETNDAVDTVVLLMNYVEKKHLFFHEIVF